MIHVTEHKQTTHNLKSESFLSAKKLYLPLSQHIGKPSEVIVSKGDSVEESQLLAKSCSFISSNLSAPASGKILAIDDYFHPIYKRSPAITLEVDSSAKPKKYPALSEISALSKEDILEKVKQAGIVGLGGAAFPTPVKLVPPREIEVLIINGCECEPYLACDYRLMVEKLDEIFKGIEIVSRLLSPKRVIFAVEENKPEAIKRINLYISLKKTELKNISIAVLKSAYPQGGEKQLIYSVTKRKVPPTKLPLDVGCVVHNVGTCYAIYEAVYCSKPLIERLVTFCGDALVRPRNLWVKIGTTLSELRENKLIEFKSDPVKIICGGPMMGVALDSLDYPIIKATGGFLFLTENTHPEPETACLRCGRCVDVCPMNLLPLEYVRKVKSNQFDLLDQSNIVDCMECGSCSYVCPARIPIVHYLRVGKRYKIDKG